jgi:hypothetical protein
LARRYCSTPSSHMCSSKQSHLVLGHSTPTPADNVSPAETYVAPPLWMMRRQRRRKRHQDPNVPSATSSFSANRDDNLSVPSSHQFGFLNFLSKTNDCFTRRDARYLIEVRSALHSARLPPLAETTPPDESSILPEHSAPRISHIHHTSDAALTLDFKTQSQNSSG